MTTHLKLENGVICPVNSEPSAETESISIRGRIIGITDGEDDKTCFVFQKGDDFVRFYLDRNARPASRLLMLLCSTLTTLRTSELVIDSRQGDEPHQSRLKMTVEVDGEEMSGVAPHDLPSGYWRRNATRIEMVRSAIGLIESPAPDASTATAGELAAHAPLVLEGLTQGDASVTAVDARTLTLVRNYPLFYLVYDGQYRIDDGVDAIYAQADRVVVAQSRNFFTDKERAAFVDGLREGINALPGRHIFMTDDQQSICRYLEMVARQMDRVR